MSASSDPSPSSSAAVSHQLGLLRAHPHPNHLHLTTPPPVALAHAYPPSAPPPSPASAPRDYRKGNWTLYETLVLITARRLDNDRRTGSVGAACAGTSSPPQPAEQRWKWVENYCWMNGCLRSQNQCNDKWDNLLRDYKKVRDYEARRAAALPDAGASQPQPQQLPSYWTMERQNRKELNLPTNLAPEVYNALCDVISRRATGCGGSASAIAPSAMAPPLLTLPQPQPFPRAQEHPNHSQPQPPPLLQLPPATSVSAEEETTGSSGSGSDGIGDGEPKAKRQRRQRVERLGSSMVRGASMLARTLVACEDKRERRHQEMLELEERRMRLEVERNEMRSQGFAGLIAAISGLSGAIFALVSSDQPPPPKR